MSRTPPETLMPLDQVERRILIIRGQKVLLDSDLANLYKVSTKALNQAVKRNRSRFPDDFMFKLATGEVRALEEYRRVSVSRSQIVTLKNPRGQNLKYAPYAFTEQGVAMLSSVLASTRAVQVNIAIMRAFVRLRELVASNQALAKRLQDMERKYDGQFAIIFEVIQKLMAPSDDLPRNGLGFAVDH